MSKLKIFCHIHPAESMAITHTLRVAGQVTEIEVDVCSVCLSQLTTAKKRIAGFISDTVNPAEAESSYYDGLRAGIEDCDITDRYAAAEYGWDQAFEYVDSCIAALKAD